MKNLFIVLVLGCCSLTWGHGQAMLEVDGKIKIADDNSSAESGMIRWNTSTSDFEGYNGSEWVSLTQSLSFSATKFGTVKACENKMIDPADGAADSQFGKSLDINDEYIVVGAYRDDEIALNAGAAYIYDCNGTNEIELKPQDLTAGDAFGNDVSVYKDWMMIGAPFDDITSPQTGTVYSYFNNGSWTFSEKFNATDRSTNDYFGYSVDNSEILDFLSRPEPVALIGAYGKNSSTGAAYLFRYGTGWDQSHQFLASDGAQNDQFGYDVSIYGGFVLIGAPGDSDNGSSSGSAYFYLYNSIQNQWSQTKIKPDDGSASSSFGTSVHIDGNYMIIGAPSEDEIADNSGAAYIFHRVNGTWVQQAKLKACDVSPNSSFGISVKISGDHAIIGASSDDLANGSNSGSAYIFERLGTEWHQKTKLVPSDGTTNFNFGLGTAIDGEKAVVGSGGHSINGGTSGAIYIF